MNHKSLACDPSGGSEYMEAFHINGEEEGWRRSRYKYKDLDGDSQLLPTRKLRLRGGMMKRTIEISSTSTEIVCASTLGIKCREPGTESKV